MNSPALQGTFLPSLLEIKVHQKSRSILHILKTEIKGEEELGQIEALLNSHPDIKKWSIDLEDIDNVMRVECDKRLKEKQLLKLIRSTNINCEPLEE